MKRVGFLVAALALAGCGGSDGTFVHVAIARDGGNAAITKIDLALLLGGKPAAATLTEPGGGAITFPTSVTLSIGKGEGTLDVTAIGRDATGAEVGRDESTTTVKLDSTSSLQLTLHVNVPTDDMGPPADLGGADLATADMTGSIVTAPDMAVLDMWSAPVPDMAFTPVPDMAAPSPDLANTPTTPPSAPQGVSAKAGDSSAVVTWSAPASTGGSPINYYAVNASPGGASVKTPDGNTLQATITGLTNGGGYTFTVQAFNSVGNSAASPATSVVIPFGVPNAPTGATAQASTAKTALVRWTAPTNNNGSAVQSYLVTPSPATVSPVQVDVANTQVSIINLTANTAYTFSVSAQNAAGTGPQSASSSSITVGDVPTLPQSVNAVRQADGSIVVSWAAPSSTNSYPISGYRVQLEAGGALYDTNSATGLSFTHAPPNIATGQAYFFNISAENAMGYGNNAVSPTLTYQPPPVPTTPTGLAVYGNAGTACLSWNAVSTASSYVLYYSTASGIVSSGGGSTRTFGPGGGGAIDGLPTGTLYFAIKAVNSSGSSAISAEVVETNKACNEI